MPDKVRHAIVIRQAFKIVKRNGVFIQFTYGLLSPVPERHQQRLSASRGRITPSASGAIFRPRASGVIRPKRVLPDEAGRRTRHIFSAFAEGRSRSQDRTPLHLNPFTLLVAVVLSAQATDVGVNKATPALFSVADTPKKMAALGVEGLKHYIKTLGLFNAKAKNIIALSHKLTQDFGGKVPETREELVTLPGVGRKTANVWLNCVLGHPTIAVDTHVFRVANRTGLAKGQRRRRRPSGNCWKKAIPAEYHAARPSLVNPSRTLCLQGAQPGMRQVHHTKLVRVQGKDRLRLLLSFRHGKRDAESPGQ